MDNNLVPPDFDYKSFCAFNCTSVNNDLTSSSYRNNYCNYIKNNNNEDNMN